MIMMGINRALSATHSTLQQSLNESAEHIKSYTLRKQKKKKNEGHNTVTE